MKVYQQTLRGNRSSERGIRYRMLKASEVDAIRVKSARLAKIVCDREDTPDEARGEVRRTIFLREGVKACLLSVTKNAVPAPTTEERPGPPKEDGSPGKAIKMSVEPTIPDDAWIGVDLKTLTLPGALTYEFDDATGEGLFTSQDDGYLCAIVFGRNHEPDISAADEVLKKEQTVSTV